MKYLIEAMAVVGVLAVLVVLAFITQAFIPADGYNPFM